MTPCDFRPFFVNEYIFYFNLFLNSLERFKIGLN
jgi:hypothetical protein